MSFVRERDAMLRDDESLPMDLRQAFAGYAGVEPDVEARARLLASIEQAAREAPRDDVVAPIASTKKPVYLRLVSLTLLGLVLAGLWWMAREDAQLAVVQTAQDAPQSSPSQTALVRHQTVEQAPQAVRTPEPVRVEPAVAAVAPRAKRRKQATVAAPSVAFEHVSKADAAQELPLLTRARRALARDPAAALALTDQHLATFPAGTFVQEREVIAIEALMRAGDGAAARARAAAFRVRYPSSTHLERVSVILGEP